MSMGECVHDWVGVNGCELVYVSERKRVREKERERKTGRG